MRIRLVWQLAFHFGRCCLLFALQMIKRDENKGEQSRGKVQGAADYGNAYAARDGSRNSRGSPRFGLSHQTANRHWNWANEMLVNWMWQHGLSQGKHANRAKRVGWARMELPAPNWNEIISQAKGPEHLINAIPKEYFAGRNYGSVCIQVLCCLIAVNSVIMSLYSKRKKKHIVALWLRTENYLLRLHCDYRRKYTLLIDIFLTY